MEIIISPEWRRRFAPHAPDWAVLAYFALCAAREAAYQNGSPRTFRRFSEAAQRALYSLEWVWSPNSEPELAAKFFSQIFEALQ
jgi:hypothetical protein